jgi:hypothetical protein
VTRNKTNVNKSQQCTQQQKQKQIQNTLMSSTVGWFVGCVLSRIVVELNPESQRGPGGGPKENNCNERWRDVGPRNS